MLGKIQGDKGFHVRKLFTLHIHASSEGTESKLQSLKGGEDRFRQLLKIRGPVRQNRACTSHSQASTSQPSPPLNRSYTLALVNPPPYKQIHNLSLPTERLESQLLEQYCQSLQIRLTPRHVFHQAVCFKCPPPGSNKYFRRPPTGIPSSHCYRLKYPEARAVGSTRLATIWEAPRGEQTEEVGRCVKRRQNGAMESRSKRGGWEVGLAAGGRANATIEMADTIGSSRRGYHPRNVARGSCDRSTEQRRLSRRGDEGTTLDRKRLLAEKAFKLKRRVIGIF